MFPFLTDDPDIAIINGTYTVSVPPDSSFSISDQLQIQVSASAGCHYAGITLHFESGIPILTGQDMNLEILVAPSGIFVFEGEENGRDYSGTFITGFLDRLGYNYTYSNSYPASLLGFETVFLSHGNLGQNLDKGTMFTEEHSLMVQEFLENGGNVYIEMGGLFHRIISANYSNKEAMKQLFGVASIQSSWIENPIDSLMGVEGTPLEEVLFTESNQFYNWYIDRLFPASGSVVPFYENNFGNVSMIFDGTATYGHKTFYISYSLAELFDRDAISSRYNILLKVMDFFGYSLPQGYILSNFSSDKRVGGAPLEVTFTDISITDPNYPVISWQWDFDNDGTIDSYDQNPVWTYNDGGTYDVKLIISNGIKADTLVREGSITVNTGYLVYEGVPNGISFSGTFIRDYLQEFSYNETYRNILPENLSGFSAVFLSFGNYETALTIFDNQMAGIIIDYLDNGGYVYLEGGNALGIDQVGNTQLLNLFGLASASNGTASNPIDSLLGQPGALTNEMTFNGNNQVSNSWIDKYVPSAYGVTAFIENGYGTVAVQQSITKWPAYILLFLCPVQTYRWKFSKYKGGVAQPIAKLF